MARNEMHSGDFGTAVVGTFVDESNNIVNISGYNALQMVFTKPGNSAFGQPSYKFTRDATLFSDGTDGKAQYVMQSGEVDTLGTWQAQGYVRLPSGQWYSDVTTFKVLRNL